MTGLLELKDKIKLIYSKNDVFIIPVVKFLLAFVTVSMLNGRMGYMTRVDNVAIVLVAALICSFMPLGCIILFGALFSLLHMYALSLEVALVGLCLYLVIATLYFRFSPKDAIAVVLTPILFAIKLPYVMPIAMGLLGNPAGAVPVGCGIVVYYFLSHVVANATAISSLDEGETTAKLKLLIDGMLDNKAMVVMIVSFAATIIIVYLIRRMALDYAWTIAMAAGAIVNLMILLVGDLLYDTNMSVGGAVLGSVIAIATAKVIEFFRFCVDYSRTEKVQFEDDEYYYYVKAVPKMSVAAPSRTVKKINAQRKAHSATRTSSAGSSRSAAQGIHEEYGTREGYGTRENHTTAGTARTARTAARPAYTNRNTARDVMTERTYMNRSAVGQEPFYRGAQINQKISDDIEDIEDDIEDFEFENLNEDFERQE